MKVFFNYKNYFINVALLFGADGLSATPLVARIIRINVMKKSLIVIIFFIGCESSILDTYSSSPSILYSLPTDSYVKLTLENSYNTIVSILVDGQQAAGAHQINVDTDGFPEGIYFYTLTAKGINDNSYFEVTRRMILITK